MSTTDLPHEIHDHAGILPAPDGSSLLSAFQQTRAELARGAREEEVKLVPQWKGALRIVYRYPDGGADPIIRAVERANQSSARGKQDGKRDYVRDANADVLIACCADIEFRPPDGEWAPLQADAPTRINRRLAEHMQLELPEQLRSPARFILRHLFSPKAAETGEYEGDVSLITQAGQIVQWLEGSERVADEALRGE